MTIELSIIIPTYKRHESLVRTLTSVARYRPSCSEVIVIDQSPDNEKQSVTFRSRYPFVRYVCVSTVGLPYARNVGIHQSTGAILLFIDDDTLIHPNCFTEHLASHTKADIHAVAGRISQMNKNVSWAQTSSVAAINPETGETTGNFDLDYNGTVQYATGGHMSIKRNVFKTAGLFNPRFNGNALFEDVEFSCRIRKKGFMIYYNANAIVYHYPVENGGCHESDTTPYLIERLHNHILFYLLHIKKIPSKGMLQYVKNLIEYISRRKNKGHSMRLVFLCLISLVKAYVDAIISVVSNPKLSE